MNITPAEVTSEHLACRLTLLAKRMGYSAIMDSVERAKIQGVVFDVMDAEQRSEYIALLRENDEDILDEIEAEDERIDAEFRQAVGDIDGYLLSEVQKGKIDLVNIITGHPDYFRCSTILSYDSTITDDDGYSKAFKAVTKTSELISNPLPVTDDDKRIIAIALERLDAANQQFNA